jgi:hypothetical protein
MTLPRRHIGGFRRTRDVVARRSLLVMLAVASSAVAAPADRVVVDAKTLTRVHDPVVVRTGLLAGAPDRATARYRLYAARQGTLVPIPFQFDARGPDGELVLSADGADVDFSFDDDDELVFMAKDTGDRLGTGDLPPASDAALEVTVTDRTHAQQGWAYLVHFPSDPPPRSPIRYATFDTSRQEARAVSYEVSYSHEPSNYLAAVRVPPAAGGTGENLFARIMMRISPTFSLLVTTWRTTLTERSFSVVSDGVKNGPVRAIRRVRQSLDRGRAFPEVPNGRVYTYYYASSFTTPSTFSIPWLVLKTLRGFDFESVAELGAPAAGMRYWDASNPSGISFTGEARPEGADGDHDWWVISGSSGTCLQSLLIPDEWRQWGIRRGIVMQDRGGGDVGAGYSLLSMTSLRRAGAYKIATAMVMLPRAYRPGDESEALAAFRDPLEAVVQPVGRNGILARRSAPGS